MATVSVGLGSGRFGDDEEDRAGLLLNRATKGGACERLTAPRAPNEAVVVGTKAGPKHGRSMRRLPVPFFGGAADWWRSLKSGCVKGPFPLGGLYWYEVLLIAAISSVEASTRLGCAEQWRMCVVS